jgi:hypothetical protein
VVLSKAYHENELFLKLMNLSLNNCDDLLIFFLAAYTRSPSPARHDSRFDFSCQESVLHSL